MKCNACPVEVDLPFRCTYCGEHFCPQHRLPENHACPEYWRVKVPRLIPETRNREGAPPALRRPVGIFGYAGSALRFSKTEMRHVATGTGLVTVVGLSYFAGGRFSMATIGIAAVLFTAGFILHELAHKLVAQSYGLWAEFRLDPSGALLTLISAVSPFKIIAPGAVVIAGSASRKSIGRTASAGPIVNVLIAVVLLGVASLVHWNPMHDAAKYGASVNSLISFFNLIPLGVLDGRKIYWWKKGFWTALFSLSLLLVLYFYAFAFR